jgi:ABC-type glycerol-3-phosphate transport system permease component
MGDFYVDWGGLMAASALMTLPSVTVFLVFQRYLVSGLSEGAVKG